MRIQVTGNIEPGGTLMLKKKLVLSFPEKVVTKPITYKLVKEFDLVFNILRAEITSDMEGKMLI
ncbi:MAG: (Fe-S)-binding protein, partial [Actinomycetia bacterium]|nr:(Fe-S)-binding protein [Actinomycetes bacterium]